MKKFFMLLMLAAISKFSTAQAYEGQAQYNKKNQSAVLVEYKYPIETIENTLKDRLERQGLKIKKSKGFMVVYNAVISSISNTPMEYAFMVDKKSKREKETTVITMVINAPGEINTTVENAEKAKTFLNDLAPAIDGLNTNNMLEEQEKVLAKAQKKLKNLEDDQSNYEKKIKNLEQDLRDNAKEQTSQREEVKRQQDILDAIKAKKK
jgi:DNA repair exonuclease SbcCD ATPase subunit